MSEESTDNLPVEAQEPNESAAELPKAKPERTAGGLIRPPKDLDLAKVVRLRLQGNTQTDIAKIMGCSQQLIAKVLKDFQFLTDETRGIKAYAENEAEILDYIRMLAGTAIIEQLQDPKRRKSVDLLRLNNVFGTVFDKMRLLRNQSTNNIAALSKMVMDAHKRRGGGDEE